MRGTAILLTMIAMPAISCSSPSNRADSSLAEKNAQSTLLKYRDCMYSAADQYSQLSATPQEASEAAQARCGGEYLSYRRAVEDYFLSLVSARGASMAQREASEKSEETKSALKGKVIQLVVEARAKR